MYIVCKAGLNWCLSSSYIHWSVNAPLEHPCPGCRSCIMWIHGWQVHSFGVEFFLHQVQFFIEELVHFHCFLVNCASDGLRRGINGKVINQSPTSLMIQWQPKPGISKSPGPTNRLEQLPHNWAGNTLRLYSFLFCEWFLGKWILQSDHQPGKKERITLPVTPAWSIDETDNR